MAVTITAEKNKKGVFIPKAIESIVPYKVYDEVRGLADKGHQIEEIRLRCERRASVTSCGKNIALSTVMSREEMNLIFADICDNSLYAHRETINNGYITLEGGLRVGVCGRASVDGGRLLGIYDISSINIRIPHPIRRVGEPVCRLLRESEGSKGVLIYAPPGEGKTTLLSAVCAKMAGGENPLRVCVIDTRGELAPSLSDTRLCIDILSGYPRGLGIEIATRTMNAQLIACDEIGDVSEAEAILSAQNSGVPFIASAHADNLYSLLMRTAIARLHTFRVFGSYVLIKRTDGGDFVYTVSDWEEADAILHGGGRCDNSGMRYRERKKAEL